MRHPRLPVLVLAALLLWAGPAAARTLQVVASFTVLADMVRQVGGDRVQVTSLVGPNGDPHAYEPSPDDARRLKAADVVFINGLGLEGWMTRLVTASGAQGKPVVATEGLQTRRMEENGRPVVDPHAWNSMGNAPAYIGNIVRALSTADPDGAADYRERGARYGAELQALDGYARHQVASVPPGRRKVLTSHDAFGYFGAAYGVTFLSPVGLSTESEASAKVVAALIRQVKAEKVRTYFLESAADPRLVRQVANATGAEPGGVLFVETLSAADGPAPTYAAMFRYNVDALVAAMRPE